MVGSTLSLASIETSDVSVRFDARIEHIYRKSPNQRRQTLL